MTEEARRRPLNRHEGQGSIKKTTASKVVSIIFIIFGVLALSCIGISVIAAIAIPNMIAAQKNAGESTTIGSMRAIESAQTIYIERYSQSYAPSLKELEKSELIGPGLATGKFQGYQFVISSKDIKNGYTVIATPMSSETGHRVFKVTQTGIIYFKTDGSGEWQKLGGTPGK